MKRVYNFSAGPSILPLDVLIKAQKEFLDYQNSGMSVMEMSHRSKVYMNIIESAEKNLREIMNIPNNYKVLFLQGGASTQFSMIPLNLFKNKKADYVVTGQWADKASKEAMRYGDVKIVASSKDKNYSYIPEVLKDELRKDADYVHITYNNTIYGTKFTQIPDTGNVPLVADFSSAILSEEIDVSKFGLIYAGAQKNIGIAGLTVVIIREDLIGEALPFTPTMLMYKTHSENNSLYNTPPTYAIYISGIIFEFIKEKGGIKEIEKNNIKKAKLLYDVIDNSKMYKGTVNIKDRSLMNVTFVTGNEEIDNKFISEATNELIVNIKGYRTIGGMRASIYNGMPIEYVEALSKYMIKFENENYK